MAWLWSTSEPLPLDEQQQRSWEHINWSITYSSDEESHIDVSESSILLEPLEDISPTRSRRRTRTSESSLEVDDEDEVRPHPSTRRRCWTPFRLLLLLIVLATVLVFVDDEPPPPLVAVVPPLSGPEQQQVRTTRQWSMAHKDRTPPLAFRQQEVARFYHQAGFQRTSKMGSVAILVVAVVWAVKEVRQQRRSVCEI